MKKNVPELSKLELNQKNVMELLFKAKATPQTKEVIKSTFYKKTSSRKAPIIFLDQNVVFSHNNLIRYWLGQIQTIHQQNPTLTPAAGIINYKGQPWTNDNRALFALYYLATASNQLPGFQDGEKSAETPDLSSFYETGLEPTYAPNDSKFNIRDAEYALNDLGVTIDDQTHVD